jgi:7,8-dihydroneopterin aldolase/epimerase/oxygenase
VTDVISIRGLRVRTRIGVTDEERANPRDVIIGIDIETDTRQAGGSDDLAHTIDYEKATEEVARLVRSSEARLIEHLAERIAAHFSGLYGVERIIVEVVKDEPPIDERIREVAVRIVRP